MAVDSHAKLVHTAKDGGTPPAPAPELAPALAPTPAPAEEGEGEGGGEPDWAEAAVLLNWV